ncbi:hypothetical protein REPUB_Repub15cG0131500 [Reevesia pubescens]
MEAALVTGGAQLIAKALEEAEKDTYNWLKRKYGYVKHISSNFKKLVKEKQCLIDKESDVETELNNSRPMKEKTEECQTWLETVANIRSEIEKLEYDFKNKPSTCLCGLCPWCALHKLGKRIVKKTREATALKDVLSKITTMRDKKASIPHGHRWNNDVRTVNHPSLENHVATLIEWLKGEKLKRICIWGPPGVGKTTIMKTVLDKVPESCEFDYIFTVTVTSEDIQEVIWRRIGMGTGEKAALISEKLKDKKYLLFLDEVSSTINLEEVGIRSIHKGGKVVFASRDKYSGDTDEDIKVRRLSKEDAGKLFWKIVGSDLKKRREIKSIGDKIINLCGGMPPMIILMGKKLEQVEDLARWRDIKYQFQSPSIEFWQELEEYYRSFKLVYDGLPDESHRNCLLYWAIFPLGEEINRDYMIDCWIAEQFLKEPRLHARRDKGHNVLAEFVTKLLVEKGEQLGHFKMFDCFQNAAFRIANDQRDLNIFAANGKTIDNEEWIRARRLSLARVSLSSLPKRPQCRGMLALFFHENSLTEFPGDFFKFMTDLRVLGLKETGITTLPSSISKLEDLKGLFLNNGSQLVQLPRQIRNLQNLEILDVTGIYSLPSEISQLKNLRCLRVSFTDAGNQQHEHMIPADTISQLSNLEELSLDVSPNIIRWNENADAIASEITELEELTHLHFYFTNFQSFETFINRSNSWNSNDTTREFAGLRSFSIFVGQEINSSASDFNVFECSAEKHLKFSAGDAFPEAVSKVLKQANSFELIGHRTACNLTDDLSADTLQDLEVCIVKECDKMQSIVNGNANTKGGVVFQCLKKLHMRKLRNMVCIWRGKIASESFGSLTTLTLKECNCIKNLFTLEMVSQLSKLQNLQVEDCTMIEKIIDADSECKSSTLWPSWLSSHIGKWGRRFAFAGSTVRSTSFPELKNFQLCSLPKLSSICDAPLECHCLETILIKTCGELKSLPRILENASKLREIHCAKDWWEGQQWPNNETEKRFRTFRRDPI